MRPATASQFLLSLWVLELDKVTLVAPLSREEGDGSLT
jgi:hypothetical protein